MAISFREFPWYIQFLLFAALGLLIAGAGELVPFSPVAQTATNLKRLVDQRNALKNEVDTLRVHERRYGELRAEMEALQKQLDTLKTIVPEEKELDEFIRMLQGAAAASGVQIRRLTAQPVNAKEYHYEMPFDIQVDGPYYSLLDFFSRLSRLSRIINVGDISFSGLGEVRSAKYPVRPGTTVTGTFTATTFFTKAGEGPPAKPGTKQPGKPN
ncbi:MAG: type 4a pilus biogenesis protein PilO [Candidatus Acidiferrales bacterium]|jgi:Tfp pilus assembly protein PilO